MQVPELGEFRLGDWLVCQAEGSLSADGHLVRLEPRVMDVLACLAAEPGKMVPKEELLEKVWGGTFVEEGVLSQAIHTLRKALGDDARQPRYIQTIHRRGYRLLVPVLPAEPRGATPTPAAPAPAPEIHTPSWRSRWLGLGLAGIAVAVVLWSTWNRLGTNGREAGAGEGGMARGPRIVVLPFQNLGKPASAFFADGLTEEITKDLASLPALQVISRTSAMQYEGARKSLPEIGRELRVDYVLEGTVRWAEGVDGRPRVRITPQLIRVADDAHVWADSFDRDVEDIFEVQAEISSRVIGQLGIKLLPEAKQALGTPPTENLEAYQAYLRGLELRNQPFYSDEHLLMAVPMFERATALDPGFAAAWAELSQTHSYLAFNSDRSYDRIEKARQALNRAIALAPGLPAVRLAQAYFTYRCLDDFPAAQRQLAAAARLSPNDTEIHQTLGFVLRRQGRLAEAIEELQRAFSLDPRTFKLVWAIAETYRALREYEHADQSYAEAISLAPDQPFYWEEKTLNRLDWTGSVEEARAVLAAAPIPEDPKLMPVAFELDLYERDYRQSLSLLSPERMRALTLLEQSRLSVLKVVVLERLGESRAARAAAEENRVALEARMVQFPREAFYRGYLAVTLAQLGRGSEAVAQAEQAVRQWRHDAFTGPRLIELQAAVDALLGRRRQAISHLARLLASSYQSPLSVADLRLNPIWDSLRDDPAFESLLRRYGD